MVSDKKKQAGATKAKRDPHSQLKKMNMLGQLAFGIVHDIRNSLQILRASSTMIRNRTTDTNTLRNVDAIDTVIENTAQMIERVLHFSNKSTDLISEIDLRSSLEETISLSRYLLPAYIKVDFQKPAEAMMLMGNSVELSQAFLNLIKNAADAIEEKSGPGVISIAVRECFPWIEVKVKDNGCGIGREQLKSVFDPLYTTKADGTGIGLANVWATMESHGGVISVNSSLGEGTEFTLMFPKKNDT